MFNDTHLIAAQIDRLHTMIENYPTLLDDEFDQDLCNLEQELEELSHLLDD